MKTLLLSFDIEEFDTLQEYQDAPDNEIYDISYRGTLEILKLLEKNNLRATFFTTASFVLKYKKLIKEISKNNEIALHGYYHKNRNESLDELKKAKRELEKIMGKGVIGFRAPRLRKIPFSDLKEIGIKYDSSLHPTYIPGRYFNLFKKRKLFVENEIVEIPISVGLFRLPFFWIFFRNFPLRYSKICTIFCGEYINILFHPWEFVELDNYKLPLSLKRNTGLKLFNKLDNYLKWCKKKEYKDFTFSEYLTKIL